MPSTNGIVSHWRILSPLLPDLVYHLDQKEHGKKVSRVLFRAREELITVKAIEVMIRP